MNDFITAYDSYVLRNGKCKMCGESINIQGARFTTDSDNKILEVKSVGEYRPCPCVCTSWLDSTTGYQFEALRIDHPTLIQYAMLPFHWCGYVGINEKHPLYRKDYYDSPIEGVDVNGGLTYAAKKVYSPLWWFGFDFHHCDDDGGSLAEVKDHLNILASRLKELEDD